MDASSYCRAEDDESSDLLNARIDILNSIELLNSVDLIEPLDIDLGPPSNHCHFENFSVAAVDNSILNSAGLLLSNYEAVINDNFMGYNFDLTIPSAHTNHQYDVNHSGEVVHPVMQSMGCGGDTIAQINTDPVFGQVSTRPKSKRGRKRKIKYPEVSDKPDENVATFMAFDGLTKRTSSDCSLTNDLEDFAKLNHFKNPMRTRHQVDSTQNSIENFHRC